MKSIVIQFTVILMASPYANAQISQMVIDYGLKEASRNEKLIGRFVDEVNSSIGEKPDQATRNLQIKSTQYLLNQSDENWDSFTNAAYECAKSISGKSANSSIRSSEYKNQFFKTFKEYFKVDARDYLDPQEIKDTKFSFALNSSINNKNGALETIDKLEKMLMNQYGPHVEKWDIYPEWYFNLELNKVYCLINMNSLDRAEGILNSLDDNMLTQVELGRVRHAKMLIKNKRIWSD